MLPLCPYDNRFFKKLVELFYHDDTVESGSVPQVVIDNTSDRVVYKFDYYDMVFFQ